MRLVPIFSSASLPEIGLPPSRRLALAVDALHPRLQRRHFLGRAGAGRRGQDDGGAHAVELALGVVGQARDIGVFRRAQRIGDADGGRRRPCPRGQRLGLPVDVGLIDPFGLARLDPGLEARGFGLGDERFGGLRRLLLRHSGRAGQADGQRRKRNGPQHLTQPLVHVRLAAGRAPRRKAGWWRRPRPSSGFVDGQEIGDRLTELGPGHRGHMGAGDFGIACRRAAPPRARGPSRCRCRPPRRPPAWEW